MHITFMFFLEMVHVFIFDCTRAPLLHSLFSSCREWGYSPVVVCSLLIAVASLVVEHRLHTGFSSCGSGALEHRLDSCGSQA